MTLAKPLKNSKGFIRNSTLILLAFATAYFSRIVDSAGAPSVINFLHFAAIPSACGMALLKSRTRNQNQITIVWSILMGLMILLSVMLASAIVNDAGEINVVLDFLLLGEPFLLILALISLPITPRSLEKLRTWLIRFGFANLAFAAAQYVLFMVLGLHPKAGNPDYVQGVFYHSGAGHVVSASVSLTFGLYYFFSAKKVPLWIRISVLTATFFHMLLADAKQVLLSFLVAFVLLLLTKFKSIFEAMKYVVPTLLFGFIFLWCVQNVPAFGAFQTWARPDIYGPDGEATLLKSAALRIIPIYFTSPLNWLVGLGPGHTVGRLGGWMLTNYWHLLGPLGATQHPASGDVWTAVGQSWLGNQSSMFSPLFGWAGIWGDLGFLGLAAYLYLGFLVWRYLCRDDFTKFLLLTIFIFGLIFSQMEEPGYMLFIAIIIGIRWHENRLRPKK
ncbi:MAG: hypothetical protein QNJ46_02285 [Leptolyngbyaceae cyanobacterium MO_188.B28]|nr:hypothetical protein [Leptolyngbyaceae cyanobacterium MO_188.B28]